jgi:predicted nucleotidyltransferase
MTRQDILARLKEIEPALRERGVLHAALFGSRARGDETPESDIDILIEADPALRMTIYEYVGLKDFIAEFFAIKTDVVNVRNLKPRVAESVVEDAVYAF